MPGFDRDDEVFEVPTAAERQKADLFFADLIGRPVAQPDTMAAQPVRSRPQSIGPGRIFDAVVHGGASRAALGESVDDDWEPIAFPRSSIPISRLRTGDLVVQRALGEGQLGSLRVLGKDISTHGLYGPDGLMRADTLVLRRAATSGGTASEGRTESEQASAPFQVKLTDPAAITAQARESKYRWAGDRVQLELTGGGVEVQRQVSANGLFEIPSGTSSQATLSTVYGGSGSRSYLRWRLAAGGPPSTFRPGVPHTVEISTRLRLSLWAFVPPLTTKNVTSTAVEIDSAQVDLLRDADVDDLSLVWTITWDRREKSSDPAKPPTWHDGFAPRGQTRETYRINYLKALIAALHPKIQVIAGYEIVRATPGTQKPPQEMSDKEKKTARKDAALAATAADFADWLGKATPDDIKKYAESISTFFGSRSLDVDGVGYDFEFDQLSARHRANLALLYRETSSAVAHRNGVVSYANAPFTEDGVNSYGFMKAQPFSLAATGLNLLARPMCFDAVASTSLPNIEASIACALRDPADTSKKGGAGLHPSQVQFGIWADKVQGGVSDLCRRVLRPNRIGLLVYNLPPVDPGASAMLRKCKDWNALLNPNEGPAGQDAQPLQVPRGSGGWPPPFTAT